MRLKREAAIMVLSEGFAQDPDRLARFRRKAELEQIRSTAADAMKRCTR
jgi:hypothetical protein